ncbi:MAG: nicotinamide mononucleotide transporter [Ruminococcaceae bacterium]|nr:nicotinamide mononucleotide transporter [Oscillospiraceae bacterium]
MRRIHNPFRDLSIFERILWLSSLLIVIIAFCFSPEKSVLNFFASLVGVTALIFIAKGYVIGQILIVIFAVLYGIISFQFKYYGEMFTYVFMSLPMAIMSIFSWIRHPYKETKAVKVHKIRAKEIALMLALMVIVTFGFYFVLRALGTANLTFSTISVATTFIAVFLTFMRSPYYALGYTANDLVLIVLWTLASTKNTAYIPMIFCFVVFLVNDIYGFISWKRMEKYQRQD